MMMITMRAFETAKQRWPKISGDTRVIVTLNNEVHTPIGSGMVAVHQGHIQTVFDVVKIKVSTGDMAYNETHDILVVNSG